MLVNVSSALCRAIKNFRHTLETIFGRGFPTEPIWALEHGWYLNEPRSNLNYKPLSVKDILGNGLLWAVPKHRRSYEKRLMRRFGVPKYHLKILTKKTNILMCANCGHDYEAGLLCGNCYEKVKIETKEMQDAIQKKLGLNPVEQDVIVIYEGEQGDRTDSFWKDKQVIEMPKKKPEWFSRNLLQGSTAESSDSKEVKPVDLA